MISFPFFDPTRPPPPSQSSLDQSFVQNFLSTRRRRQPERRVTSTVASASISELKRKLTDLVRVIDLLKTKKATLEKELQSKPESGCGHAGIVELEQLRLNISEKLQQLRDPALNEQLRRRLGARRKKRAWQKRRNARLKDQKETQRKNREQLREKIDQWQREQHKLLEKEKEAQKELDYASHFLADIHREKAICKRYLAKFEKVHESRRRYNSRDDQGDDADIAELTKKWTSKLSECIREEKRLKDVLARRSAANYQRRVENEWNRTLFGDVIPKKFEHPLLVAERDWEVLVQTRRDWDACLVAEGEDASAIPLGWVLPPKEPTPEWAQYLMDAS